MTVLDATNPETEVETEVVEAGTPETEVELDDDGNPKPAPEPEPELEEVEHEGQKYKIPKALKGALLMNADYTRKTQELAEQRRANEEAARQQMAEQKLHREHLTELARVVGYNDVLAQFEKADWPQIRANNPAQYDQLWFQYQQTKEARDKAVVALQAKVQERTSSEQQETAKRLEQARATIQRDIPDWSPELAGKLNQFAMTQGFTADELRQVTDPRIIKVLHSAWLGSQAKAAAAATTRAKPAQIVKPLPTVAGNSPADKARPNDPSGDKLSMDEWLKRRNAQINRKRGH